MCDLQGLMAELEAREGHFNQVQDRGEALIMDRHPATKTVEVGKRCKTVC